MLVHHFRDNYKSWTDVIDLPGEVRGRQRGAQDSSLPAAGRPPPAVVVAGCFWDNSCSSLLLMHASSLRGFFAPPQDGLTPLYYAAINENMTCLRYLLSLGARDDVEVVADVSCHAFLPGRRLLCVLVAACIRGRVPTLRRSSARDSNSRVLPPCFAIPAPLRAVCISLMRNDPLLLRLMPSRAPNARTRRMTMPSSRRRARAPRSSRRSTAATAPRK